MRENAWIILMSKCSGKSVQEWKLSLRKEASAVRPSKQLSYLRPDLYIVFSCAAVASLPPNSQLYHSLPRSRSLSAANVKGTITHVTERRGDRPPGEREGERERCVLEID